MQFGELVHEVHVVLQEGPPRLRAIVKLIVVPELNGGKIELDYFFVRPVEKCTLTLNHKISYAKVKFYYSSFMFKRHPQMILLHSL